MQNARLFLTIGAANGALAVILGAFGAHMLRPHLSPQMYDVFHIAEQYHFYHALGLLAVGLTALHLPASRYLAWSGWLMIAGIILFCGSLYVLAVTDVRWLGAITPFGGTAFIAAWILLAVGVAKGL
ncbi:MAG TPA: DUF423 domain-containing protein [Gammaproteobacteria bacterium]|nr:DUF423 domain-containing protein [Gammaproteobacteria bacterium]